MSVIGEIVDDLEFDRREKSLTAIAFVAVLTLGLILGFGLNESTSFDRLEQASASSVQVDKSELGYLRGRN